MKGCPICDGEVSKVETTFSLFDDRIKISPIIGYECISCNEILIDEDESKRIDRLISTPFYKERIENARRGVKSK